jgi:hypothetical protein
VVTVAPLEDGRYQALFEDLRFQSVTRMMQRRTPALGRYVILDSHLQVESENGSAP